MGSGSGVGWGSDWGQGGVLGVGSRGSGWGAVGNRSGGCKVGGAKMPKAGLPLSAQAPRRIGGHFAPSCALAMCIDVGCKATPREKRSWPLPKPD